MNTTSKNEISALLANKVTPQPDSIHMLWLLLKSVQIFEKKQARQIGQKLFVYASATDVIQLIEVGVSFALLKGSTPGIWEKTAEGSIFCQLSHWRYWTPTPEAVEVLGDENALAIFPGREMFENRPVVIDLFAGVGGLTSAFEAVGFNVKVAVDNDPQACEAHEKNFPHCTVVRGDINDISAEPKKMLCNAHGLEPRAIAGIIGGPPCQGFSYMGERASQDERNLLTSRFMDVVEEIEPAFFLMENVAGLLTSGALPTFGSYIRRHGKSIGEPASKIVDRLPIAPIAKRDRQFRKKTLSQAITLYREKLYLEFAAETFTSSVGALNLKRAFNELPTWLVTRTALAYGATEASIEFKDISRAIQSSKKDLAQMVFGLFVDILIDQGKISDSEVEGYLSSIAEKLPSVLRYEIEELIGEYIEAPRSEVYRGVKIGPVLANLIKRASTKYDVCAPRVLNAAAFGAPQSRRRLFLIGIHKRLNRTFLFPEEKFGLPGVQESLRLHTLPDAPTVLQAIGDLPDVDGFDSLIAGDQLPSAKLANYPSEYAAKMRLKGPIEFKDFSLPRPTWNPFVVDCCNRTIHTDEVLDRLRGTNEGQQEETSHKTRLDRTKVSHTLRAGTREGKGSHTAVRPVHFQHNRVITVREGARLMGYPDWMTFHHTKWHGFRLVGNGVPFQLGAQVARALLEQLQASPDE